MVKLMQKAVSMAAAGTPLAITSVFAQDHLRVRMACTKTEGTPLWLRDYAASIGPQKCSMYLAV